MDAKQELVKSWLTKAFRDLASAERLSSGPAPLLDTAVYHCQQAAEKSIKGWLTYRDQPFQKTHDVRLLITLAFEIEPEFAKWFEAAETLTPLATIYRYPGEFTIPSDAEYIEAYIQAQQLVLFIVNLLPTEFQP